MLVACRLAGLSALGAHYAGVKWRAQCGAAHAPQGHGGAPAFCWEPPDEAELLASVDRVDGKRAGFSHDFNAGRACLTRFGRAAVDAFVKLSLRWRLRRGNTQAQPIKPQHCHRV
jgi:hypothetical protein